ncbi:MAG: hypothetical protein HC800_16425, partial [Phormidesmis sp. RL_2_1]|nr:hypothetical protein [Phormidesmis sp. RL_2_1]
MEIARKVSQRVGAAFLGAGIAGGAMVAVTTTMDAPVIAQVNGAQVVAQVNEPDIGTPVRPLTVERANRASPIAEDYQVGALQQDYTGSLWVGSRQGLVRIDPETGRILARVAVPNRFIDAMAQGQGG